MDPIPEEVQSHDQTYTSEGGAEDGVGRSGIAIKAVSLEDMEPPKKIMLKVELNGKPVGKSEEIFIQEREVIINWETFYEITEITEVVLEELVTHPLVFTVLSENVLPTEEEPVEPKKGNKGKKEKGKREKSPSLKSKSVKDQSVSNESKKTKKSLASSKSALTNPAEAFPILGVANLDMIPLLLGQGEVDEVLYLNPTIEQKGSEAIAWENLPKLNVLVSMTGNILDGISGMFTNILSFTLESLHNTSPDCNENMEVATLLPNDQVIKFKTGTLLLDDSLWFSKRKKWFGLTDLTGQGALSLYKAKENISNLLNTMDFQVTNSLLVEKPRIQWNQLCRSFLNVESEGFFKQKILEFNCWPVEVLIPSSSQKSEGKKKAGRVSDGKINHYMTFLDLTKLIYPGEKSVRLTSQLYHYSEEGMKMKFGSLHILFDEIAAPPDVEDTKSKASSKKGGKAEKAESTKSPNKSKKGSVKSKEGKKHKGKDQVEEVQEEVKVDEPVVPKEPEPVLNDEGEPIFLIVEVELLNPLVNKRDEEKVLESIHKIIPEREQLTTQQLETINATKLYEDCIKSLIHNVHDEYQIFFNANEPLKNSCKNFLMHLHVTGAYSKMAESVREAITAHVKEAIGPADLGEMKLESQDLLTTLYQEMANKMYSIVSSYPDPSMEKYEPEVTYENLQYFESEALEEGDYDKAHYYLLQRLEKSEKADPQVWIDFAGYWKKQLEFEKAEECAKEAISLDPRHTNSLLFHGLLSWVTEDFDKAEVFLLAVVTFSPHCLEGWVALHMLHKQMAKLKEAGAELLRAKECISIEQPEQAGRKSTLSWGSGIAEGERIFLLTGAKLLCLSFPEFTELALSYDLLLHGRSISCLYYLAVCHYQQGRYTNSLVHLEEVLKMHWEDDRFWALKGHNFYKLGMLEEAKQAYHVALNFKDQEDQHLINLRLGNILISEGDYKGARDNYLLNCRDSPTPLSWLGLGIAAFVDDDMEEAELALSEANMLDCRLGRVWGYLALVNLMLNRPLIFNRCILQAFKYGFEDQALVERIDHLVKLVQPIEN